MIQPNKHSYDLDHKLVENENDLKTLKGDEKFLIDVNDIKLPFKKSNNENNNKNAFLPALTKNRKDFTKQFKNALVIIDDLRLIISDLNSEENGNYNKNYEKENEKGFVLPTMQEIMKIEENDLYHQLGMVDTVSNGLGNGFKHKRYWTRSKSSNLVKTHLMGAGSTGNKAHNPDNTNDVNNFYIRLIKRIQT